MTERFTRKNEELKTRVEAKKPTPKQIDDYINGLTVGDFEDLEPLFAPTQEDIKEKGME